MSRGSSDLAKGNKFLKQLLYVQHVDKEKDTTSEMSEQFLHEYILSDRKIFSDKNFTSKLKNPQVNFDILKTSLKDYIIDVQVYSNPLPGITFKSNVAIHAFVVFKTRSKSNSKETWWSLEKNGTHIVLQQSLDKDKVTKKTYDAEKMETKRLEPVEELKSTHGNYKSIKYLLRVIWETSQLNKRYNFLTSNCQNFASIVFKKLTGGKWRTVTSAIVDYFRRLDKKKKILSPIEVDAIKYESIIIDDKFDYYKAIIEGRKKDFKELIEKNMTRESLNSVDSQGYTLLEWATAFSTSDWPIDQYLKKKGAKTESDDGLFRQHVFFIALQYLPLKSKQAKTQFLSFDGIDINGTNKSSDTPLHLALYGEKWEIAKKILNQLKDYNVNMTNSSGLTPLHLAAIYKSDIGLFKKILYRTNSENINKADNSRSTALHYAILNKSIIAVEELLKHKEVKVNVKNNKNYTPLYFASQWPNIPVDLFKMILEKSENINQQDNDGYTALHLAIMKESITAVQELLKHKDVDFNLKNSKSLTPLHCASCKPKIPIDLFKMILEKSDIKAQDDDGDTALHLAIMKESITAVEELLKHKDVDINAKNNKSLTPLHFACMWTKIPIHLFKMILEKSKNINYQYNDGNTALHLAILGGSITAAEELLRHKDVDINAKNNKSLTPLHFAIQWPKIPIHLFKMILEKSDIKAQDDDGNTALHLALLVESKTAVKELLRHKDVDFNLKNNYNQTPLHFAIQWPKIPIHLFKIILEKSDIKAQYDGGNTALHLAILNKSITAVEELLKHKDVDVDVKNNYNLTPLYFAIQWPKIPIHLFKMILEKSDIKAQARAQDDDGNTALHLALLVESKTAVKELLRHKDVDFNLKNNYNHTPLHFASYKPKIPIDLFKMILEKSDIKAQDDDGNTALHLALLVESKTAVKELLKHKDVDFNLKNSKSLTPLHCASCKPKIPIDLFKMILEKSEINQQDDDGNTALHMAILNESITAAEELLKHKDLDINTKNNEGLTPLHFAIQWPKIPIHLFKMILEKSDIKAQDDDGNTALHLAIMKKSITAVEELLKHKDVDINAKNNKSLTPLHFACMWPKIPVDLFKMILEKSDIKAQNICGNTALHLAIMKESITAVKELLKHKDVDFNLKNNYNDTPLHFASYKPKIPIDLFKMILEKSDIKAQDDDGDTALHLAILNEPITAVKELLKHKDLDINTKNNEGLTPLHCASQRPNIPVDLFKMILEKSDINQQDDDGDTALHIAISNESITAVDELLKHKDVEVN